MTWIKDVRGCRVDTRVVFQLEEVQVHRVALCVRKIVW